MPTSALRRLCRPGGYADVGIGSRARSGLQCGSGRHNPDVHDSCRGPARSRSAARPRRSVGTSDESRRNPLRVQPSVLSREATLRITRAAAGREDLELREFGVVREVPGYADPLHADPLTQQAIQPAGRHNHEVGIVGVRGIQLTGLSQVGGRPAQPVQVVHAVGIGHEPGLELSGRPRVVLAGPRPPPVHRRSLVRSAEYPRRRLCRPPGYADLTLDRLPGRGSARGRLA